LPIDENEFGKYKDTLRYVIDFLHRNPDKAYTASEIAQALGVKLDIILEWLKWNAFGTLLALSYGQVWPIDSADVGGIAYYKYNRKYQAIP
jgi:hypothetical protein